MPHEIVDPRKVVVQIASIFDNVKIPYFITGGFAVSVWGRPRATFDIDIVVELTEPKQIGPFASEVLTLGLPDENGEVILLTPTAKVPNGGKMF